MQKSTTKSRDIACKAKFFPHLRQVAKIYVATSHNVVWLETIKISKQRTAFKWCFAQEVDRCLKDCDKQRLQTTVSMNLWKIFAGHTGDWFDVRTASICTTDLWDALKRFILNSLKFKVAPYPIIVSLDTLRKLFCRIKGVPGRFGCQKRSLIFGSKQLIFRGHRKSSQKPSKTSKFSFARNPSLHSKRTKVRTSVFRLQLKPLVWFLRNPLPIQTNFCSFHWAFVNFCDGPGLWAGKNNQVFFEQSFEQNPQAAEKMALKLQSLLQCWVPVVPEYTHL